jgi:S-adenosylmethionine decarboxylase
MENQGVKGADVAQGAEASVNASATMNESMFLVTEGVPTLEIGNSQEDSVEGGFEGPEKTLEIDFKPGVGHPNGLREIPRDKIDAILDAAKCTIISVISNAHGDAYLLSESSLFIHPYHMLIKTCGRTTLLCCYPILQKCAEELGMQVDWIAYSRKNFTFPKAQKFPHLSFEQEASYLDTLFNGVGSAYILGPMNADHWFVYNVDYMEPPYTGTERKLDIMMFDMAPAVAKMFTKDQAAQAGKSSAQLGKEVSDTSGISNLLPGVQLDSFMFDPCGYSANGIVFGSYITIHVTPEPECSYASFETNANLKSFNSLIKNVLQVFKPKRFVMTLFADEGALKEMTEDPFSNKTIDVPGFGSYKMRSKSGTSFEEDYTFEMGNYMLLEDGKTTPTRGSKLTRQASRKYSDIDG